MALRTPKNWSLDSYTDATWTNLVNEQAIVSSIIIANNSVGAINVEMRVTESGSSISQILPVAEIAAGESWTFDVRSVVLVADQAIQIRADGPGLEFYASGAVSV